MTSSGDAISVERLIAAPAERIFELLADPGRHPDIDGSGSVRQARSGGRRLGMGDRFGMDMKLGVAYSTHNTVVEFEENRRIAWKTSVTSPIGRLVGGRIWRYELQPVEGGTLVRETWDISSEAIPSRYAIRFLGGMTKDNMTRTLERIARLVED